MLFNRVFRLIAVSEGQIPVVTQEHDANLHVPICESCQKPEECIAALSGQKFRTSDNNRHMHLFCVPSTKPDHA